MAMAQAVVGNLTTAERGILAAINTGASSLSLVGSDFIVLCYLLFKDLRKFSFKLVFFLALSVKSMAMAQAVVGNLTAAERGILAAINIGASSLSLVGSDFIVLCYLLFKELRKFSFKLVFFLALSVKSMAMAQAVVGNLTAAERGILAAINIGASSLSLVGSDFIVLCYLLFKELRKFSFKLVFFLALSVNTMAMAQAVVGNITAAERGILTAINTGASSLSLVGSDFIVLCYLLFKELRKFSFKLVFFIALSVNTMAMAQAVVGNLTAAERGILAAINTGASNLSLVGSDFIVLCYLLFKELRKFSFKLVFFLALSVNTMATAQAVVGNLTAAERGILAAINAGASSLSLVGSGFIVLCYLLFKELRKFSFKLVFFLALSDMFCSFFSIIGDPSKEYFCYAQGYTTHFFCVASFLWTTTIAFTLHRTVVRHKTDVEDLEPMFHLYVWGTSGVVTVIRSIGNDHGHITHLGAWCWAQTGPTGKVVHFITFYAPLWGAILFNGITYFQVIRMLNNATRMAVGMSDRAHESGSRPDMKALNRWGYYPLILIGSWFFGTINRIHDFIEPGHKILWLYVLDVGMAALMGLFNSIAYGLNSSVRRAIYERLDMLPESFRRWFPKSLRGRGQQQESELVLLETDEQR